MKYFKSKSGKVFYGIGLMFDTIDLDIMYYEKKFDEYLHREITREEFVAAYEQVIKKLNEKVYGTLERPLR